MAVGSICQFVSKSELKHFLHFLFLFVYMYTQLDYHYYKFLFICIFCLFDNDTYITQIPVSSHPVACWLSNLVGTVAWITFYMRSVATRRSATKNSHYHKNFCPNFYFFPVVLVQNIARCYLVVSFENNDNKMK